MPKEEKSVPEYRLIGIRIENEMLEQGLNQAQLASNIGVGTSTISLWISGKRCPDRTNAIKLEKYFNKPRGYFEADGESMSSEKVVVNGKTYDIISSKIATGYFDVIMKLAQLLDDGKITEETFNKRLDQLDKY